MALSLKKFPCFHFCFISFRYARKIKKKNRKKKCGTSREGELEDRRAKNKKGLHWCQALEFSRRKQEHGDKVCGVLENSF